MANQLSSSPIVTDDPTTSSPIMNKPSTVKRGSSALRGNLTRVQRDRDPLFYYQVEQILGIGSMGSVVKVRKREAVVGGSARPDLQRHYRKEKVLHACFQLPLLGGLFHTCFKGLLHFKPNAYEDNEDEETPFFDSVHRSHSSRDSVPDYINAAASSVSSSSPRSPKHDMLYAMKSIHLSRVTDHRFVQELKNEVAILRSLDHPHIVKAIETFEHRNQLFIIMELCYGGDLYSRDPYTEEHAARIVRSVLSAIAYMHSKNILHRDLKYENILFVNNSPHAEVKLIDFGLSAAFGHDELTDGVGTIYTMAPEVLKGKYAKQADVWSCGVIAYMLLSSQMPFYGKKRQHIVEQIMSGKYEFNGRRWKRISNPAKEFVSDLLVVDPSERLTAEQALSAAWLNRGFSATLRSPSADEFEAAHQSMVNYAKYSKLKQVALMVIAHRSTSEEIGILRKLFQKYDAEGRGHVTYEQFQKTILGAGYSQDACRQIFDAVDQDGSGLIRYTEFLASTIEAQGAIDERRLAEAFDRLDSDDSGYITVDNLKGILGDEFPDAEVEAILKECANDGRVSYMDFLAQWHTQHETRRLDFMADITNLTFDSGHSMPQNVVLEDKDTSPTTNAMSRANFIQGKYQETSQSSKASKNPIEPSAIAVQHEGDHVYADV